MDNSVPLFAGSVSEWTETQIQLMYWMKFYNTYHFSKEEKDRSPEGLVEYDILFDEWVDRRNYMEEQKRSGRRTAQNAQDVYQIG